MQWTKWKNRNRNSIETETRKNNIHGVKHLSYKLLIICIFSINSDAHSVDDVRAASVHWRKSWNWTFNEQDELVHSTHARTHNVNDDKFSTQKYADGKGVPIATDFCVKMGTNLLKMLDKRANLHRNRCGKCFTKGFSTDIRLISRFSSDDLDTRTWVQLV